MPRQHLTRCLYAVLLLLLGACADDAAPPAKVLTEQTQAIDKAADVDQLIQDAADAQRQAIDQQSQ